MRGRRRRSKVVGHCSTTRPNGAGQIPAPHQEDRSTIHRMRKLGYDSKQIAAATGLRPAPSFLVYPNGGSSRRKNSRSVMPNHLQPAWDHARKTTLNAQEPSFSRGHTYGLYVYFLVFKAWSKEESAPLISLITAVLSGGSNFSSWPSIISNAISGSFVATSKKSRSIPRRRKP